MERFLALVRTVVAESAECSSCPVAAVTLESTRGDGPLLAAADDAFAAWTAERAHQRPRVVRARPGCRVVKPALPEPPARS